MPPSRLTLLNRSGLFVLLIAFQLFNPAHSDLVVATSRTPLNLPFYVAQAHGYFNDLAEPVVLNSCVSGEKCMQAMLDNEADIATVSDMVIMTHYLDESAFSVLATMVTAPDYVAIIARKSASIRQIADFKKKRVGYVEGTSSHYYLETALILSGLSMSDIQPVTGQPPELNEMLESGKLDAIAMWQPWAYEASRALAEESIRLSTSETYALRFNLVSRNGLGAKDRKQLIPLFSALSSAAEFIEHHPAETREILRKALQLPVEFSDDLWKNCKFRLELESGLLQTIDNQARWKLASQGRSLTDRPNLRGFIDDNPLKGFKPDLVNWSE